MLSSLSLYGPDQFQGSALVKLNNTLPEHYIQGKNLFLAPFASKSADFYEINRPKGAEKQAVSLRNGPEKQVVSLCNGLEK